MKNRSQQPKTADDLIAALESAETGSRMLDVQLAYFLSEATEGSDGGPANPRLPAKWHALGEFPAIAKIMLDEGFSWQSVCDVLDCEAPAYTTSLDASIPGENIVFVIRSAKRSRWGAIHKTAEGGEIFGWGATEALARRTAAMRAWKKAAIEAQGKVRPAAERMEDRTDELRPDPAAAESASRKSAINGRDNEVSLEQSLGHAMSEQEDRDWEILF